VRESLKREARYASAASSRVMPVWMLLNEGVSKEGDLDLALAINSREVIINLQLPLL
jgi:hypothetical protein